MENVELPTPEDVRFYQEHGWYVAGQVIPHALLDELRVLIEAHQRRPASARISAEIGHADWKPVDGAGSRNSEFLSVQEPAMRRLSLLPAIGAIAARLAGTSAIRLFDDQAVVKPPGDEDSAVGWHTDDSYWSTCASGSMLTAWIPFDDSSVKDGTLLVVDGSHLWPESEHLRRFNDKNLEGLQSTIGRDFPDSAILPLELKKGQVSFHHMRLVHASTPNRTSRDRVAVAVHLQDRDNAHRDFLDTKGNPVVLPHDRLCRRTPEGRPDYRDPNVFPTLWEAPGHG